MLLTILSLITLAVTAALAWYIWRVPEAPHCPRCGSATVATPPRATSAGPAAWLDRWAAPRACAACGWVGRQRRGGEPQSVRHTWPRSRR